MYYRCDFRQHGKRPVPEFDASNILRVLNYFPFINRRHVPKLTEAMSDPDWVQLFCDMSAATITQLHERKMIDLDMVWKTVSQFFHQAIQLRGFETVPNPAEAFHRDREPGSRMQLLVAGTQAPVIFQSRVDRCIDVLRVVRPRKVTLTFSGANPYGNMQRLGIPGGVVTMNEAADMEIYFRQRIQENPLPSGVEVNLHRETRSDSTLSNIDQFFEDKDLDPLGNHHIVIISSLFHLPRFIDLTTARAKEKSLPISTLSFVSAEDPWRVHTQAVEQVDYLKSCMYEFFLLLYNADNLEQLFTPVQQAV